MVRSAQHPCVNGRAIPQSEHLHQHRLRWRWTIGRMHQEHGAQFLKRVEGVLPIGRFPCVAILERGSLSLIACGLWRASYLDALRLRHGRQIADRRWSHNGVHAMCRIFVIFVVGICLARGFAPLDCNVHGLDASPHLNRMIDVDWCGSGEAVLSASCSANAWPATDGQGAQERRAFDAPGGKMLEDASKLCGGAASSRGAR